jgi:hypothetical protein
VRDHSFMIDPQRTPIVPQPPFKWLAWMIVGAAGAASMGGLTWRDAPEVVGKGLFLVGLCAGAVAAAWLVVQSNRNR